MTHPRPDVCDDCGGVLYPGTGVTRVSRWTGNTLPGPYHPDPDDCRRVLRAIVLG